MLRKLGFEGDQVADPTVHGVMVYYPIFHGARDRSLQNEVAPEKDVEGLHASWSGRLYHDIRTIDPEGKKRPTEFKTKADTKLFLVTYKREKP